MDDDPQKTLSDANRAGVTFLIVDLETALTFLDTADISQQPKTVQRCVQNARKAYETVLEFAERLPLDDIEREAVDSKLKVLKGRLEANGQEF